MRRRTACRPILRAQRSGGSAPDGAFAGRDVRMRPRITDPRDAHGAAIALRWRERKSRRPSAADCVKRFATGGDVHENQGMAVRDRRALPFKRGPCFCGALFFRPASSGSSGRSTTGTPIAKPRLMSPPTRTWIGGDRVTETNDVAIATPPRATTTARRVRSIGFRSVVGWPIHSKSSAKRRSSV